MASTAMDLTKLEYAGLLENLTPNEAASAFSARTKQISKLPTDLADWLQERSRIEEQYASGLRKLSSRKYLEESGDFGSFTESWKQTLAAVSDIANIHSLLAKNIEEELAPKLRKFASTDEELVLLPSIGNNLTGMAKDMEAIQRKTMKQRDRSKGTKFSAELDNAAAQWDSQAPFALEKLQVVDERRWDIVRSSLVMLQTYETDLSGARQQAGQQCMEALLQSTVDDEIKTWPIRAVQNRHLRAESIKAPSLAEPSGSMASLPSSSRGEREEDTGQRPPSAAEPTTPHAGSRFNPLRRLGTVLSRKKGTQQHSPTRTPGSSSHRVSMFPFGRSGGHSADKSVPPVPSFPPLDAVASSSASGAASPVQPTAEANSERESRDRLPSSSSSSSQQQLPLDRPFTAPVLDTVDEDAGSDDRLPSMELPSSHTGTSRFDLRIRDKPIAEEENNSVQRVQEARKSLFVAMGTPSANPHSVRGRRAYQSMMITQPVNFLQPQNSGPGNDGAGGDSSSVPPRATTPTPRATTPLFHLPNPQTQPLPQVSAQATGAPSVGSGNMAAEPLTSAVAPDPVTVPHVSVPAEPKMGSPLLSTPATTVAPTPAPTPAQTQVASQNNFGRTQPPPPPPPRFHSSRPSDASPKLQGLPRAADSIPPPLRVGSMSSSTRTTALPPLGSPELGSGYQFKSLPLGSRAETPSSDSHSIKSGYSQSSGLNVSFSTYRPDMSVEGWNASITEKAVIQQQQGQQQEQGGDGFGLVATVVGEILMVFNHHGYYQPTTAHILRLDNRELIDKIASNPKVVKPSDKFENEYILDISKMAKPLVVLKYQRVPVQRAERYLPFRVETESKIEGNVVYLSTHLSRHPAFDFGQSFMSPIPQIEISNLTVRVYFDDGTTSGAGQIADCRLKPYTGRFTRASNMVYWILDNFQLEPTAGANDVPTTTLLMRVSSAQGQSAPRPARVEVSWNANFGILPARYDEVGVSVQEGGARVSRLSMGGSSAVGGPGGGGMISSSHLAPVDPFGDEAERSRSRSRNRSSNGSTRSSLDSSERSWAVVRPSRMMSGKYVFELKSGQEEPPSLSSVAASSHHVSTAGPVENTASMGNVGVAAGANSGSAVSGPVPRALSQTSVLGPVSAPAPGSGETPLSDEIMRNAVAASESTSSDPRGLDRPYPSPDSNSSEGGAPIDLAPVGSKFDYTTDSKRTESGLSSLNGREGEQPRVTASPPILSTLPLTTLEMLPVVSGEHEKAEGQPRDLQSSSGPEFVTAPAPVLMSEAGREREENDVLHTVSNSVLNQGHGSPGGENRSGTMEAATGASTNRDASVNSGKKGTTGAVTETNTKGGGVDADDAGVDTITVTIAAEDKPDLDTGADADAESGAVMDSQKFGPAPPNILTNATGPKALNGSLPRWQDVMANENKVGKGEEAPEPTSATMPGGFD